MPRRKGGMSKFHVLPDWDNRMIAFGLPKRRRVVRRRRGAGFGDFIGNTLSGIGSGIGGGVHNLLGSLFGGARKRKRRVRGRGNSDVVVVPAVVEQPTSLLGKLNKIAKDSGVINKALGQFGFEGLSEAAKKLGYGRRRKRGGMPQSMQRRHKGGRLMQLAF